MLRPAAGAHPALAGQPDVRLQELTAEERTWDAPGAEYERPRDIGRIPGLGLPPRGARSGYARLQ